MTRRLTEEEQQEWDSVARQTRRLKKSKPPSDPVRKKTPPVAAPAMPKRAHEKTVPTPPPVPPKKSAAPAAPLEILPRREATRRLKSRPRVEATLDLHDLTQDEAHTALIAFVQQAILQGNRHLAIITGKGSRGEGVLRRAVPRWLETAPLRRHISALAHAIPEKGGEGVLHVLLKKR